MQNINENAIECLLASGYQYIHSAEIAPDSATPERESFVDVLLIEQLHQAVKRINPTIAQPALDEAIKTIQRISSPELLASRAEAAEQKGYPRFAAKLRDRVIL